MITFADLGKQVLVRTTTKQPDGQYRMSFENVNAKLYAYNNVEHTVSVIFLKDMYIKTLPSDQIKVIDYE